jgi:hypothetical protein
MDVDIHQLISDRLDGLKDKGLLSEYLISWNGHSGRLFPKVAVWAAGNGTDEDLAGELRWLIGDLVKGSDLVLLPPRPNEQNSARDELLRA